MAHNPARSGDDKGRSEIERTCRNGFIYEDGGCGIAGVGIYRDDGCGQRALAGGIEIIDIESAGFHLGAGGATEGDILGILTKGGKDFGLILSAPVVIAEFDILTFDKVGDDEAFQRGEIIAGDGEICPHGKCKLAQAGNAGHIDGGLSLHHEFGEARTCHGESGAGHNGEPTRGEGTAVQGQGTGIEHGSLYYHALQSGGA